MRSPQQQEQEQTIIQDKSQFQLKHQYWHRWVQWVYTVRQQRSNAFKALGYQNVLEQRLLSKTFKVWAQAHQQEKFQQFLRLRNSLHQQQQQKNHQQHIHEERYEKSKTQSREYNETQSNNMSLAIRFNQRKIYAKCMTVWIKYVIACNQFEQNLSEIFIRILLKKYFQIIHEFKCKSIEKKSKKAANVLNSGKKQELIQNTESQSQMNLVTPSHLINQIDRFPATTQNFKQLLQQNPTFKRSQPVQPKASTLYAGFQRNTFLGQSRRSQFSTLSAQLDYNSRRKFKPITQLPSIPDLDNISKQVSQNDKALLKKQFKSPIKSYQTQRDSQQMNKDHSVSNLSQSNIAQQNQNPETRLKKKIISALVQEKLLTLAIMRGQEFEEGLEYENYRQKTVNGLKKLRDVVIR